MKKSLGLATVLLAVPSVFAAASGSIVLENRSDFIYESWNNVEVADPASEDEDAKMDKEAGLGFNAARLRTDFKGQFANDVKYRVRLRWDKTFGTNTKVGSMNSLDAAVDNAYVQPKFGEALSVRIGKFSVDGQGHEEATISSQDTYLMSTIDKNYLAGLGNAYGVRPIITLKGLGDISLTLANNNLATSDDSLAQTMLVYGIGFSGKIGMFEPVANFHMVPKTSWTEGQMDAGLGLRTTVDKFIATVDFQTQTTSTGEILIAKKLDKVLSTNMVLQYKGENLRPQAKVLYDMLYMGDDQTATVLGLAGGVEYYPEEDANFRYHLMVSDKMTTPIVDDKDQDTQSELKVYLGVSCKLDMWKF
jgi:hypothetical protein